MTAYLLECIDCGKHHLPTDAKYLCPTCGTKRKEMEPLSGLLRCIYDYETATKFFTEESLSQNKAEGFERWAPLLPLESMTSLPPLLISATPLRAADKLADEFGLDSLWLKDDTVMPTASFKDRASSLVVAMAKELGHATIATASTGNAATALAGYAAAAELSSVIFVSAYAPKAKLVQIVVYGGQLILLDTNYDGAYELSIQACDELGWYNRNTAYNPFTVEGKKTAAFEIWEQLEYHAPDWVIVPTGDGVIAAGIEKGFSDLAAMRLIERVPRLALVQAAGCKPIVKAFESGADEIVPEQNPKTIADSIQVGVPRAGRWLLKALRTTNGVALAVDDGEILNAISELGHTSGIFAEPAAAASIAGLKKLVADGIIGSDDTVVALITGSGLKDVSAVMKAMQIPNPIEPTLDAVKRMLKF
ncbi:MAG: threonine synthase [Pseudomonadota bacterium]